MFERDFLIGFCGGVSAARNGMDDLEKESIGMETFEEFKGAGVYADLLLDLTFKKAFNPDTRNKICLIALLNAVLEGEISAPIRDVHSRNKEYSGGSNENRISIFDLHCIDSTGRRFIVEVQLAKMTNIVNRAIFYSSQAVVLQGERGRGYHYDLDPVITVVFMDFGIFDDSEYVRCAKFRDRGGKVLSDTLCIALVEIPKFKKSLEELRTPLDKGLYALKNIKNLREMPPGYAGGSFELLFQTAKLAKLTKEEQRMIDAAQKAKWDECAIRKYNEEQRTQGFSRGLEQGLQQGLRQGLQQGLDRGMKQGIERGLKRGMAQCKLAMVKEMRKNGIPLEIIAKCAGLSIEDVEKL